MAITADRPSTPPVINDAGDANLAGVSPSPTNHPHRHRRGWTSQPVNVPARRWSALIVTLVVAAVAYLAVTRMDQSLGRSPTATGTTLAVCLLTLTAIGLRRRLPGINLGSMAVWTQAHLYIGVFVAVVYGLHVPNIIADGGIEWPLSVAFVVVTASGFYGIYASRTYPKRIRISNAGLVDDRLEFLQLGDAVLDSDDHSMATEALRDHYRQSVRPFLSSSRGPWFSIWPTKHHRHRIVSDLESLDRYLDEQNRVAAKRMVEIVDQADRFDFTGVLRRRLKVWVAVHAAATVLLIVGSVLHIAMVLVYRS